jgi:hypothetical protein
VESSALTEGKAVRAFFRRRVLGHRHDLSSQHAGRRALGAGWLYAGRFTQCHQCFTSREAQLQFIRDIAPVRAISRERNLVGVNPSVLTGTVPEFIAYAKANPGNLIGLPTPANALGITGVAAFAALLEKLPVFW